MELLSNKRRYIRTLTARNEKYHLSYNIYNGVTRYFFRNNFFFFFFLTLFIGIIRRFCRLNNVNKLRAV